MELSAYIEKVGDLPAAKQFGVKARTVQSWRRRERYPRPEQARFIVEITQRQVTFEGIYGSARESKS